MKRIPSHWVALTDQILVSGVNFVIGVLLARTFGVDVFGSYSIAVAFLFYANTFQSSLVISPMMTAIPYETDDARRQELLSGFFGYALILSLLSIMGISLITSLLGAMVPTLHLGGNVGPLLLAIIGFQFQDWLRKALYAQHKTEWVFLLDTLAYGGQFLLLIVLYFQHLLTPATALFSMAGVFFMAAFVIIITQKIIPNFTYAWHVVKTNWRGSRDFFLSWQLQWASSQGLTLFGGGVLGPQIVGALRVSGNLVAPVNVLFQWLDNVIPVRAVAHLKNDGLTGMNKFLSRIGWIGGVLLAVMVVALYFFAEPLLVFLYGESYRPYAYLVVLQAFYCWMSHFYRLEFFACRATSRTADIARASLIMAIMSIATGVLGVLWIGASALLLALILGQSVSYAYLLYRRKRFEN